MEMDGGEVLGRCWGGAGRWVGGGEKVVGNW